MASAADLRRAALALEGTSEHPHFDRAAFKAERTYVTLAADRRTANFKFTPEEQEFKCMLAPDAFTAIPNGWGRQGWTTAVLAKLSNAELHDALKIAWAHGAAKKGRTVRRAATRRRHPDGAGRTPAKSSRKRRG